MFSFLLQLVSHVLNQSSTGIDSIFSLPGEYTINGTGAYVVTPFKIING